MPKRFIPKGYHSWRGLRRRCNNPQDKDYACYGGRGITVCPRWEESFDNFISDMGSPPTGFTIDRIDTDGNYEPENCRWCSVLDQNRNRRNNILYEGKTLLQVLEDLGRVSDYPLIRERVGKGWSLEKALSAKNRNREKVEGHSLRSLASSVGLCSATLYTRLNRGLSLEEALVTTEPVTRYLYEGQLLSLYKVCLAAGVSYSNVSYRMKKLGLSLEKALVYKRGQTCT